MPRGGRRKGAGRKTAWESGCSFSETTVIRVPKVLKDEILEIAHRLDAGEEVDLVSKSLRERNDYLESKVLELEKQLLNQKHNGKEIVTKSKVKKKQGKIELDTKSKIVLSGQKLSIDRFGMGKNAVYDTKKRKTLEAFILWSQSKDPDGIAWVPDENGYVPKDVLSDELLGRLQKWIQENS